MPHVESEVAQVEDIHDWVVRASLASYRAVGQQGVPYWEIHDDPPSSSRPDITVPALRRVEKVETEDSFDSLDSAHVASLRRPGMELWVLVPSSRIARAHQVLRGLADRIQPWWLDNGGVRFGRSRTP